MDIASFLTAAATLTAFAVMCLVVAGQISQLLAAWRMLRPVPVQTAQAPARKVVFTPAPWLIIPTANAA